jgi:signal transduction histidine kinase
VHQTLERFPFPETVELRLEIAVDLPEVLADPRQVEQVLGNLVTNACQAMANKGRLSIRCDQCTGNGEQGVRISVQDTGTGITPENMGKLFEPLFTTKARGIGLGLAVSRKLAEANGGRIEVQSEPGVGSTFTLLLPVQPKGEPK